MSIKRDSFNPNTSKTNTNQQKKAPKYPMKGQPSLSVKENRNIRSANAKNSPSKFPPLSQNPSATEFINNAIHEYLLKKEMPNTLECFKEELQYTSGRKSVETSYEVQLLEAFDKGQREQFFTKWNKFIPMNIRLKDEFCSKLEFYLHIYFVVFAVHPYTKKTSMYNKNKNEFDKGEVQHFKLYLDTKGADLAQTTEFLQYYALPYVPNPLEHPSFKHIFTKEWLMELRSKLEAFLPSIFPTENNLIIYQMYNAYARGGTSEGGTMLSHDQYRDAGEYAKIIAQLEHSNQELMNILQEYNEKYGNLRQSYEALQRNEEIARNHLFESHTKWMAFLKELLGATNDLVKVIDAQRSGTNIQEKVVDSLKKKVLRYENFLNSNLEDLFSQSHDNSVFEKFSTSQDIGTPDHSSISNIAHRHHQRFEDKSAIMQGHYAPLDFAKIKDYLYTEQQNVPVLCSLLQALRWRITRTRGANARREVIISYSKHDILDIKRNQTSVLERITQHPSRKVCEFAARFVNALASDYSGRSYLLESDKLVLLFIQILKQEKGDTIIRRNSLGALQKLSLRKRPQLIMIEQDMIKWIINTLKNERETLGEYSYEYATALFMNLSLRSLGKRKCEEPGLGVLQVFNDLLEHENMQVRTFVNGTLYSLLSRPVFKEEAKTLGMDEILTYLMENSDERYRKQIQYIVEQLNSDKVEEDAQSDANDEDNDYDDMEDDDEIGEDEDMEDNIEDPNIPTGEELLAGNFSLSGPEALKQTNMIQEALEESKSVRESTIKDTRQSKNPNAPLNRPTTPTMLTKLMQQDPNTLPPELQSRPKILRTPVNADKDQFHRMIQSHYHQMAEAQRNSPEKMHPYPEDQSALNRSSVNDQNVTNTSNIVSVNENRHSFNDLNIYPPQSDSKQKEPEIKGPIEEYQQAFQSKRQLLRTPPTNIGRIGGTGQMQPSAYNYGYAPK